MKHKIAALVLAIVMVVSLLPFTVLAMQASTITLTVKGSGTVSNDVGEYTTGLGIVWQDELVDGNKVGTETFPLETEAPWGVELDGAKAGYALTADEGYYIKEIYVCHATSGELTLFDRGSWTDVTTDANGYVTSCKAIWYAAEDSTARFVFAKAPDDISVVLLGNNGTAVVSDDYSESINLTWQDSLVNGNKVGTDTINHINEFPFDDTNLKAGYWVEANEGYYIDAVYLDDEMYSSKDNAISEMIDDASQAEYKNGYMTKAILTEIMFPGDTLYISFAKIPVTEVKDKDISTGVNFKATTNELPSGTKISVDKITSGSDFNSVTTILGNKSGTFMMYNISLTSDGKAVQPSGKIKVYLPIPDGYDTSKLIVYYVNTESKAKESYPVTVETINGVKYAVFETTHFSTYILTQTAVDKNTGIPDTGTNSNTAIALCFTPIITSIFVLLFYVKKKELGKNNY